MNEWISFSNSVCALTEDGFLLYLTLALCCMPYAIFLAPEWSSRLSSDGFQPSPDVSTRYYVILHMAGQQWWPVHYSTDPDFHHRSSRRCHIQQDDLSVAYPSLLVVVLHVLPDILSNLRFFLFPSNRSDDVSIHENIRWVRDAVRNKSPRSFSFDKSTAGQNQRICSLQDHQCFFTCAHL